MSAPFVNQAQSSVSGDGTSIETQNFVDSSPMFNYQNKTHHFVDLGYDSLHSTPKQQAQPSDGKEYQALEGDENTDETASGKSGSNGMKINLNILEATKRLFRSSARSTKTEKASPDNDHDQNLKSPRQISELVVAERTEWDKKIDFLFSIIGFAVDLANVWRFPYLCYKNGGGVFLIPYTLMLIFGALPLFFLELSLGQFAKSGPISVWDKMCPAMKGVGYCAVLISWYVSFYYNVIIGWTFYYIITTLTSGDLLPWQHCDNEWNTENCFPVTPNELCKNCTRKPTANPSSASREFYERQLLQISSGEVGSFGNLRPEIVGCVAITFCLLYFSLFKGVKSSGKVVWFTATAPYIILTILLIRGIFLPGAGTGVLYYLSPRMEKLADSTVWTDAATQVLFSIGVGFGVHLTYASFNKFNHNCYRDALITACVNSGTSFYSGFVIFVYLGYIAQRMQVDINDVAQEGYGLVFQIYPEALSTLPLTKLWSILFFIMLVTLGLDSAMGGLEAVITGIMDEWNIKLIKREVLTAVVLCSSFCFSLINCTQVGGFAMNWFDKYTASTSLCCSVLFESLAIVYGYGLERFSQDIKSMIGFEPNLYWKICWKYISPLFLMFIIGLEIYNSVSVGNLEFMGYQYPGEATALGWIFGLSSIYPIPIILIWHLIKKKILKRNELETTVASNREVINFPLQSAVYV